MSETDRPAGTEPCRIVDCDRLCRSNSAGLCKMHYERIRRTGTPDPLDHRESDEAVVARFLSKIEQTATCWIWIGTVGSDGYGQFRCRGEYWIASRFAHELWIGPTKTHCIHGHEFTPANTSMHKHRDGFRRVCRKCQRERCPASSVAAGQGEVDRG